MADPQADQLQQPMQIPGMPGAVSPVQTSATQTPDVSDALQQLSLQQGQAGMQQMAQAIQRIKERQGVVDQLRQQQAQLAPHLAYSPQMAPMTGQGIGHDILNVLGNLGKGMLSVGAATGPGQAVQAGIYGPQRREYGNLAQQIQTIQKQQEPEEHVLQSSAQEAYHAPMSLAKGMEASAAQERAKAYTQNVQNHLAIAMAGIDLKKAALGSEIELNKAKAALDRAMPQILQGRNELVGYGIDVNSATREAVTNAEAQLGIDKTHPLATMIDSWLGTSFAPKAATLPSAEQPARPVGKPAITIQQKQKQAGGNVPAGTIVYDPNGKAHRADGTAPLPQGWSTQKRK